MTMHPEQRQEILSAKHAGPHAAGGRVIWRDVALVVVVAALVRAPCLVISCQDRSRQVDPDSSSYLSLADELAAGHGFGRPMVLRPGEPAQWTPELFRTPGYPAVLAASKWLTGDALLPTIILQNILGLALCAGLVVIGQRGLGRAAGLLMGLLAAVDLQAVALANSILTDFPFALLVLAATLLAARVLSRPSLPGAAATAGLLGAAALVRPAGIGLPIALGACLLAMSLKRKNLRLAMAALIVALMGSGIIGAWIIRNGRACGQYALSSVSRFNYISNFGCHTLEAAQGISYPVAFDRLTDQMGLTSADVRYHALGRQQEQRLHDVVNRVLRQYPGAFARITAKNMANLWFGPDKLLLSTLGAPPLSLGILRPSSGQPVHWSAWGLLAFNSLWLGTLYILVLRTIVLRLRGRPMQAMTWLALMAGLYVLLVASGPLGDPRLRAPATVPLLLVGAAGLAARRPAANLGRGSAPDHSLGGWSQAGDAQAAA